MVANTGTYVDAPYHRYADADDISRLDMERLANLDGVLFHWKQDERVTSAKRITETDVRGRAVLIHTGWDRHWGTEQYFDGHPFLTKNAAERLRAGGAALVGIDSYNIDDTSDGTRPVHSVLLGAGIPIVKQMCNLASLADEGFKFYAVPVKVKGTGTFPVRAFAVVKELLGLTLPWRALGFPSRGCR